MPLEFSLKNLKKKEKKKFVVTKSLHFLGFQAKARWVTCLPQNKELQF